MATLRKRRAFSAGVFRIFVVAYESDGGDFEMLVYQALGVAAGEWMIGGTGMDLFGLFGASLGDLIGSFFGAEDDFVGSYEQAWNKNNSWGVGNYMDQSSGDLRLWFTIKEL